MSLESDWLANKAKVRAYIEELMSLGFSLTLARRLAGWNITYEYDNFSDLEYPASATATPSGDSLKDSLYLLVTRSPDRVNPNQLAGAVLDAGTLYAVYMTDVPELDINTVTFKLDGSTVQVEGSTPWDFAGTAFDGSANRTTFVAGAHEIGAVVNTPSGTYNITASFIVE